MRKFHFCCNLLAAVVQQCCCIVKGWISTALYCVLVGLFSKLCKAKRVLPMNKFTFLHLTTALNSDPCFWGKHWRASFFPTIAKLAAISGSCSEADGS